MYLPSEAYPSPYGPTPTAHHPGPGYPHHPAADHYQAAAYAAKCAAQEAAYHHGGHPHHKMEYPGRSACSYDQAVNFAATMGAHFDYDSLGPLARMDPYGRGKTGRAKGKGQRKGLFEINFLPALSRTHSIEAFQNPSFLSIQSIFIPICDCWLDFNYMVCM